MKKLKLFIERISFRKNRCFCRNFTTFDSTEDRIEKEYLQGTLKVSNIEFFSSNLVYLYTCVFYMYFISSSIISEKEHDKEN